MMASSKLLVTRTNNNNNNNNSDLPLPRRDSSISSSSLSTLIADHSTMDDLLNNIYNHNRNSPPPPPRTVDEVWKDIVAGGGDDEASAAAAADTAMEADDQVRAAGAGEVPAGLEEMTLEDFLTRAGAVREEDVAGAAGVPIGYGQFQVQPPSQGGGQLVYNNGTTTSTSGGGGGGRGGKRRAVQEAPLDKATQQKQRRMIKNRESAARSRERKQAYTIELESLVTQLEEENARLLTEQAEQKKERYKWLMENLIPIVEKRRPPRALRRVQSVHW